MYTISYEEILERMLSKVPTEMDKTEGSIVYDAIAPCALELQLMYFELNSILQETFADTATREYLILRCKERGIEPFAASSSVMKAVANMEIPIGTLINCNGFIYKIFEKIDDYSYKARCEVVGVEGNRNLGQTKPLEVIEGLEYITITELLIPGEDEEDTESLRTRYLNSFDQSAYGGNVVDYIEKTNSIDGVGATKVTPVWNGGGTVKLTVVNSEFDVCSPELVDLVQETIDPNSTGDGVGLAPIGHIVTVESAVGVEVNVSTNITFVGDYTFEDLESKIKGVLEAYLLSIRKKWDTEQNSVVRVAQIEALILNVDGVLDITGTVINGNDKNIVLGENEVPILGSILGGVVSA